MPLGTLDRRPPPFFKQGPSALSKFVVCSAVALALMVADHQLGFARPLRSALVTLLQPLQWLAMQPVELAQGVARHFESLDSAQERARQVQQQALAQARRAQQTEQLTLENEQLRALIGLRSRTTPEALAAEITREAADPYSRKVIIDQGTTRGVQPGSPVIDAQGVIGQVTAVHPLTSEVTLVMHREHAIPVMNMRTGQRGVAFGDGSTDGGLELRFMAANADVQAGDLLATSGVDGVYPPGLAVARVASVERRADSGFARIRCVPLAGVASARHVLVLAPLTAPRSPAKEPTP